MAISISLAMGSMEQQANIFPSLPFAAAVAIELLVALHVACQF